MAKDLSGKWRQRRHIFTFRSVVCIQHHLKIIRSQKETHRDKNRTTACIILKRLVLNLRKTAKSLMSEWFCSQTLHLGSCMRALQNTIYSSLLNHTISTWNILLSVMGFLMLVKSKCGGNLLQKHRSFIFGPGRCLVEGPSELQKMRSWWQAFPLSPVIQQCGFLKVSQRCLQTPFFLLSYCQLWVNVTAHLQQRTVRLAHNTSSLTSYLM